MKTWIKMGWKKRKRYAVDGEDEEEVWRRRWRWRSFVAFHG